MRSVSTSIPLSPAAILAQGRRSRYVTGLENTAATNGPLGSNEVVTFAGGTLSSARQQLASLFARAWCLGRTKKYHRGHLAVELTFASALAS